MSLNRFYVEGCGEASDKIYISGPDHNHIKNVLRLRIGDEIIVSDGTSRDYLCRISDYPEDGDTVAADIVDVMDNSAELPVRVTLFQGLPKADKLEHIIQKTIELGVFAIYPVMMKRCVVKVDDSKADKKLKRYNSIAEAAAKQSQRGMIPEVKEFTDFKKALEIAGNMDMILFPYESAKGMDHSRKVISEIKALADRGFSNNDHPSVAVFVGPEGGFAPEEVKLAEEKGAKIISLGNRILRTETAGPAVMAILGFMLDN